MQLPICLIWTSTSLRKLSRFLLCQGTCLFKHIELPSLPVFTKQAALLVGGGWGVHFTEVGITERRLPASPWETIQLGICHRAEQKARLLYYYSCARRNIGVAQTLLLLRTKAVCL